MLARLISITNFSLIPFCSYGVGLCQDHTGYRIFKIDSDFEDLSKNVSRFGRGVKCPWEFFAAACREHCYSSADNVIPVEFSGFEIIRVPWQGPSIL